MAKIAWADLVNSLDPEAARPYDYRAWYCTHFHGVKQEKRGELIEAFDYIKEHEADFWVGTFTAVATYGQQRDTAKLTSGKNTAKQISFTLSDDMDDTLFAALLTVKVRVPDGWKSVSAQQGDAKLAAAVISHEGGQFVLVQAVPDKGEVVLSGGE